MVNENQKQEHTASYYAATANEQTNYPPLQGDQRADVCVIGAGFTGVATALTLAERGYDVRVDAANKVGWGASGRNGGQMIGGIAGEKHLSKVCDEDTLWQMHWRGHDIIAERVEKYGIDCDLKYGYVDVAIKPRHLSDNGPAICKHSAKKSLLLQRVLPGGEGRSGVEK